MGLLIFFVMSAFCLQLAAGEQDEQQALSQGSGIQPSVLVTWCSIGIGVIFLCYKLGRRSRPQPLVQCNLHELAEDLCNHKDLAQVPLKSLMGWMKDGVEAMTQPGADNARSEFNMKLQALRSFLENAQLMMKTDVGRNQVLQFLREYTAYNESCEEEQSETGSVRRRRYLQSSMDECSDPEYWMELHHMPDSPPLTAESGSVLVVQDPELHRQLQESFQRYTEEQDWETEAREAYNDVSESEAMAVYGGFPSADDLNEFYDR